MDVTGRSATLAFGCACCAGALPGRVFGTGLSGIGRLSVRAEAAQSQTNDRSAGLTFMKFDFLPIMDSANSPYRRLFAVEDQITALCGAADVASRGCSYEGNVRTRIITLRAREPGSQPAMAPTVSSIVSSPHRRWLISSRHAPKRSHAFVLRPLPGFWLVSGAKLI
jgi:hypothetical protein